MALQLVVKGMSGMDNDAREKSGLRQKGLRVKPIVRSILLFVVPALVVAVAYFSIPSLEKPDPRVKLKQAITLGDASSMVILTVVDADGARRFVKYSGKTNHQYNQAISLPGTNVDEPPRIKDSKGVGGYQQKLDSVMTIRSQISELARGSERLSLREEKRRAMWAKGTLAIGFVFLLFSIIFAWRTVAEHWQTGTKKDDKDDQ